jgi:hypothetical protein
MGTTHKYQDGGDSYKMLAGKPERVRPFWNPGFIYEDKFIMDFIKAGCDDMDEVYLVRDRHQWCTTVDMVMNL